MKKEYVYLREQELRIEINTRLLSSAKYIYINLIHLKYKIIFHMVPLQLK
jgi:hypothetical protein